MTTASKRDRSDRKGLNSGNLGRYKTKKIKKKKQKKTKLRNLIYTCGIVRMRPLLCCCIYLSGALKTPCLESSGFVTKIRNLTE